jgi:hypothetical protein
MLTIKQDGNMKNNCKRIHVLNINFEKNKCNGKYSITYAGKTVLYAEKNCDKDSRSVVNKNLKNKKY